MSETHLGRRIGAIRRYFRRELEIAAAQYDITATQFQVLRRLWSGEGLSAHLLAKESHLDAATMTGVLDRLEAKGIVRRERDTSDRRAVCVVLTPNGREMKKPLMTILHHVNERALAGFDDEERAQLMTLLQRVEDNLSNQA